MVQSSWTTRASFCRPRQYTMGHTQPPSGVRPTPYWERPLASMAVLISSCAFGLGVATILYLSVRRTLRSEDTQQQIGAEIDA